MIAQRLRPIGWVAAVAVAALGFYLVSLRVAAERGALESVDMQIVAAKRDIRRLQTELGTRASLRQLERWNGDVLALSAPTADQYLVNETQLAALDSDFRLASVSNDVPAAAAPRAVLTHAVARSESVVEDAEPVTLTPASVRRDLPVTPTTTPRARIQTVAMLDAGTLSEIARTAARESGGAAR